MVRDTMIRYYSILFLFTWLPMLWLRRIPLGLARDRGIAERLSLSRTFRHCSASDFERSKLRISYSEEVWSWGMKQPWSPGAKIDFEVLWFFRGLSEKKTAVWRMRQWTWTKALPCWAFRFLGLFDGWNRRLVSQRGIGATHGAVRGEAEVSPCDLDAKMDQIYIKVIKVW